MTLALYGKSRGRQRWLLLAAVLAIVAAVTFGVAGADSGRYAFAQDGDETIEPTTEGAPTEGATEEATEPPTEDPTEPAATEEATEESVTEESTQGITQESATEESQELQATGDATLHVDHVGAMAPGFQTEGDCGPFEGEFDWAFHFVFQGSSTDFTSIVASFTGGTVVHSTFEGKHAFVYVNSDNGPITLDSASATTVHNGGNQELDTTFNLSHICEGEGEAEQFNVVVSKFVDGALATEGTFGLTATWDAANRMDTGGPFTLDTADDPDFTESSPLFDAGFDYSIVENTANGLAIDGDCDDPGDTHRLLGYSVDGGAVGPTAVITDGMANATIVVHNETCDEGPFNVTLGKFVDGAAATVAFDFLVTYDVVAVPEGPLSAVDEPFSFTGTATSLDFEAGFDYSIEETGVDADCDDPGDVYQLLGYSMSTESLAAAAALTPSATIPSIVDGQSDFFIAVHNALCGPTAGTSTVIIEKEAGGDADVDASFATTGLLAQGFESLLDDLGGFVLDDDSDATLGNTITFVGLEGGVGNEFTVTEGGIEGWSLTDLSCSAEGGADISGMVTVDDVDGSVAFDIDAGAGLVITCVFTNTENPVAGTSTVTIVKDAGDLPNSTVSFSVDGFAGLTGFDLDDDPATGAVSNTQVITGISDDTFTVTEGMVAGWNLDDIVCVNDDDAEDDLEGIATASLGDREVSFDIGADLGLSITCTFFNEQALVGETPTVTPTTETPTVSPTTETPTVSPTTETPTASPTTETPTASPTTPATATEATTVAGLGPQTSTPSGVTDQGAVAGATPIAPSTGTGTNAAEQTATLGLIIAGLVAMTAGATLYAVRRRG